MPEIVSNLVGREIGPYTVIGFIGSGGMAEVWEAHDPALDRKIALKILRAAEDVPAERFVREGNLHARLNHPNILQVYAAGEHGRMRYIAMARVNGTNLKARGKVPKKEAVEILSQVATGLDYAHSKGVLHRDISASNILLEGNTSAPWAYLSDFGLAILEEGMARLTATGRIAGNMPYLARELMLGGEPSRSSDIYALGCVAFQTFCGVHPLDGKDVDEIRRSIMSPATPRFSERAAGAESLDQVFARVLAGDPAERPASANEFVAELRQALDGWDDSVIPPRLTSSTKPDWEPELATTEPDLPNAGDFAQGFLVQGSDSTARDAGDSSDATELE